MTIEHKENSDTNKINLNKSGIKEEVMRIGIWNVKTLFQKGKMQNVLEEMKNLKIKVMGISETRWTGSGSVKVKNGIFIYSGGTTHTNGVGVIILDKLVEQVAGFWPISDRVLLIKMHTKPVTISLIQLYAPTADYKDEEIEKFYEEVDEAMAQCKNHEMIFVMGDFNAKVGKGTQENIVGPFGLGQRNNRGNTLVDWCKRNGQVIMNTWYKHHPRRLWTWKSPSGRTKNQIDYLTINSRYKNAVKNIKTYPSADCNSDHNLLVSDVSVKLKNITKNRELKQIANYNLEIEEKEEVQENIKKDLQAGNLFEQIDNIDSLWEKIKHTFITVVENNVPKKYCVKKDEEWITEEIKLLFNERKRMKNTPHYNAINKRLQRKINIAKENWLDSKCKEIEELKKTNSYSLFKKIDELCKRKTHLTAGYLEDKKGNKLFMNKDKLKCWGEYIEEIYNDCSRSMAQISDVNKDGPGIMKEEIEKAIKNAPKNKAAGPDSVTTDMIKILGTEGVEIITKLANIVYESGKIPIEWTKSICIPLPKKSNATTCKQYRTISLMSHTLKILLKVILERMRNKIKSEVSNTQTGFIAGKGTRNALFMLRTIMDRSLEVNKELHVAFIDFKMAFDTVKHERMIQILRELNIDQKDLRLINNLYEMQSAAIRIDNSLSKYVKIEKGVRQGCILSPDLFNLYSEQIFRAIINKPGIKIGGKIFNNIRYADDTLLIAESESDITKLVEIVQEISEEWGLMLNTEKTVYMIIGKKNNNTKQYLTVNNSEIKRVKQYKYLGSIISEDGRSQADIISRIGLTKAAFTKLKPLLTNRNINLNTKKRVIDCYLWSILTYGSECWVLNNNNVNRLKACEMWVYRRCLKISWKDKINNNSVLNKMKVRRQVLSKIKKLQLTFFGHIMRQRSIEWDLCSGLSDKRRERGRRRTTVVSSIISETGTQNFQRLIEQTEDRDLWCSVVADVCNRYGI